MAYSFRTPVVECDDLSVWGVELVDQITRTGIGLVVLQGWPPGSSLFVRLLREEGIAVKCVLHSSPVQHGAELGEAEVVDEIFGLEQMGSIDEVGMAKDGVHRAFQAAGYQVSYVPNRIPDLAEVERVDLGPGLHVGVFAEPVWRKNVTTQLLSTGLFKDATAHVMKKPSSRYLDGLAIAEHGELPYQEFVGLQGSVHINLYVTLSECHPSTPQESYLAGVPCLMSRTSSVFKSDTELWDLTTTDEPDNPDSIFESAERLLASADRATQLARSWMIEADKRASTLWSSFVGG